ncbi:hypothetical protein KIW84_066168, partial [Lathyrus oleraceus]
KQIKIESNDISIHTKLTTYEAHMNPLKRSHKLYNSTSSIHFANFSILSLPNSNLLKLDNVNADSTRVSNLQNLLQLCAKTNSSMAGRTCHAQIIRVGFQTDILTSNMLINMYSKCSLVKDARKVFDEMPLKSVVSWNTMIGALTKISEEQQALMLFIQMLREGTLFNEFTIS